MACNIEAAVLGAAFAGLSGWPDGVDPKHSGWPHRTRVKPYEPQDEPHYARFTYKKIAAAAVLGARIL
jgi:hypothetical protein